ncbi:MAG: PLP-dependent aminotransferase family protein, partial [Myxococcota bacterium]
AQTVRSPSPARGTPGERCAFALPPPIAGPPRPPDVPFPLSGGLPDLNLVPRDALARACRRVLRRSPSLLGYHHPAGHPKLRAEVASLLRRYRGLRVGADEVFITSGAQMALFLVGQLLLRGSQGTDVAVESLGYPPAWSAFESGGARLHAVPIDDEGIRVDALSQLVHRLESRGRGLRAVYVTPHHQYPTMVLMSPSRRLALLALAAEHRFAVVEDDYDNEIHYAGQPVLPIASSDRHGSVLYIGTLSKVLAPGLRLGYIVAPRAVIEHLTHLRRVLDHQGSHAQEAAVAELFEEGEVQLQGRRVR